MIYSVWWWIKVNLIYKTICFIKGHEWSRGDYYSQEPDRCPRCFLEEEKWFLTIPDYLNILYGSICEKEWKWFDSIDFWLQDHFKLPDWWEY